jgi:hypothetical protein
MYILKILEIQYENIPFQTKGENGGLKVTINQK